MRLQENIAGQQQALVIRLGATGCEGSIRTGGKTGLFTEPADKFLLDDGCDRGLIERVHRLVQRTEYDLGSDGGQQWRTMQMRGCVGVKDRYRIGNDRSQGSGDLL